MTQPYGERTFLLLLLSGLSAEGKLLWYAAWLMPFTCLCFLVLCSHLCTCCPTMSCYAAHLMKPLLHHHLVHAAAIVVLLLHGLEVAAAWVLEFHGGIPSPGTYQGHRGKQDTRVDICHLRALQGNSASVFGDIINTSGTALLGYEEAFKLWIFWMFGYPRWGLPPPDCLAKGICS